MLIQFLVFVYMLFLYENEYLSGFEKTEVPTVCMFHILSHVACSM